MSRHEPDELLSRRAAPEPLPLFAERDPDPDSEPYQETPEEKEERYLRDERESLQQLM